MQIRPEADTSIEDHRWAVVSSAGLEDPCRELAGWKDERSDIERRLAEEERPAESDADLDPDAVTTANSTVPRSFPSILSP